jgi:hypothetical protein
MTLTNQDEQQLCELISAAKEQVQTKYGIELTGQYSVDVSKSLEENRAFILQTIKLERDKKIADKPKVAEVKVEKVVKKPVSATTNPSRKEQDLIEAQKQKEELQRLKAEEEKTIAEWKSQFNPTMIIKSPAYFEMEKYIEMVCANLSNFCIISGAGGLAKTWSSQAILKNKGVDYAYLNSFTSPLELYNFFYDNKGRVILIDDCEGIWENKSIISILKNATELNGKRTISWNSSTSKLEGRSSTTPFEGRIILLTNQLPNQEKNPHVQALLSRAFFCKLKFNHTEKIDVLREVSKKDYIGISAEERKTIMEFIERNTSEATKDLSIRSLIKCYHFYLFGREMKDTNLWKDLSMRVLQADPRKEKVLELIKTGNPVKDQEEEYCRLTGHSRADFYRIRQELLGKKSER